jgi:hypothetical protein
MPCSIEENLFGRAYLLRVRSWQQNNAAVWLAKLSCH